MKQIYLYDVIEEGYPGYYSDSRHRKEAKDTIQFRERKHPIVWDEQFLGNRKLQ